MRFLSALFGHFDVLATLCVGVGVSACRLPSGGRPHLFSSSVAMTPCQGSIAKLYLDPLEQSEASLSIGTRLLCVVGSLVVCIVRSSGRSNYLASYAKAERRHVGVVVL